MTLKDWKKTEDTKYTAVYKNKKDESDYVVLRYVISLKHQRKMWKVETEKAKTEYFKTKTQALKYAKAYMRKH